MKRIFFGISLLISTLVYAQENYPFVAETDPRVLQKLEEWKDWKFGLLMHWGPYSEWGVVESWSLCPEDEGWTQRTKGNYKSYYEYVKDYEALGKQFNPIKFDPHKWAMAAKDAGMKYMVFTTKHHDGFNMFDTKQSDYKITAPWVPFHSNAKADVTKEIFAAFRTEGFGIGAYFSKPDWHNENFWWRYFPPKDRNVNYDIKKYPERWKNFQDFTYNQINELMSQYGKVDLLWLDGGWVRPDSSKDKNIDWEKNTPDGQDVNMPRIAKMCRELQPGIIIVDRWVPGPFENYHTPEQEIPKKPLPYPWETCMTMGNSWSYVPNDQYKPTNTIIHNLIDVVAKGGNYLLNIGPGPDGEWDNTAYIRMKEIGDWMKVNGEAIYKTRAIPPYKSGDVCFTQSKDGKIIYALQLLKENDTTPAEISFSGIDVPAKSVIQLVGSHTKLTWKKEGETIHVFLPKNGNALHAVAVRIILDAR
jgi:alpha-L-fucosidase